MTTSFELSADVALFGQPLTLEVDSGSGRATIEVAEPPSLAEIIESFAGLVVPGFTLQVPAPWDSLVAIKLPAITFELTADTIGFTVDGPWTVVPGILEVGSFGLTYTKDTGGDGDDEEPGLSISLGITLLGENLDEVAWDPIEEPVPPVDPKSGRFFELTYVGLGQRQRFEPASPTASPQNMDEVMALLMTDPSPLRYDADSGWLFGTRFTVLDTVDLDLVFWDPHLYGLAAKLRGDKAGSLDGLRFEILYRKINEHLGVYHAELELPTAMRRLELGAVSATLPAAIVDIYTDGSFLIDLGFPHNLDFTRSAQVEVFPFLGRGGFYVGVLPADAVPELPSVPVNTRFGPVVAVGLGVEVGVGKTIEMGALSAGATVTMVGAFEGLLAPFLDEGGEHAGLYYRVSAVVGLVGHIYGSVNFGVVQAQVDLVATATATVTIEAHRPGVVLLEATVSVALDVRVLFVTLHFHFEAVVRAEFIIGAKTTPPWELPPSDRRLQLAAPVVELSGAPFVIDPPQRPLVAAPITLPIRFVPQVSVGTTERGAPTVELIAMLLITTTGSDEEPSPFEHMVDACFSWAVDIITGGAIGRSGPEADPELRRSDLTRLQRQLGSIYADLDDGPALHNGNRLTPDAVQTFWDQTFRYAVERWPAPTAEEDRSRYAYVPMDPRHTLDIRHDGAAIHHIDFSQHKPCSDGYQRWLAQWFEQLRIHSEAEVAGDGDAHDTGQTGAGPDAAGDPTLGSLIMVDYCRTILRTAITDALAAFDTYPYRPGADDTLESLRSRFGSEPVYNMILNEQDDETLRPIRLNLPDGGSITIPDARQPLQRMTERLAETYGVTVDPATILANNLDRADLLIAGTVVRWPQPPDDPEDEQSQLSGVQHTTTQTETLATLAEQLLSQLPADERPDDDPARAQFVADIVGWTDGLLRPGASLHLPAIAGLEPTTEQSIATMAATFQLEPEAILAANTDLTLGPLVHLPNCETLTHSDVRAAFAHADTVTTTGAAVSRYFLHGLRLPDPDEFDGVGFDGESQEPRLFPLFDLLGQQVEVSTDASSTVAEWEFELGNAEDDSASTVVTPQDMGPPGVAAAGYQGMLGPDLDDQAINEPLRSSLLVISEDRPFINQVQQVALGQPTPWTIPPTADDTTVLHLAPVGETVRSLVEEPTVVAVNAGANAEPVPFQRVTRIDVAATAVTSANGVSRYLSGLYELGATNQRSQDDLLTVLDEIGEHDRVVVAYADPNGGLHSDPVDPDATALVRTNLSTVTRPPDQPMEAAPEDPVDDDQPLRPTLTNAGRFLEVLWQGAAVNQRGLYLDYRLLGGEDPSALDTVFGTDGTGVISFLVLWDDDPARGPHHLRPVHNALAVRFQPADGGGDLVVSAQPGTTAGGALANAAGTESDTGISIERFVQANATTADLVQPGVTIHTESASYTTNVGDDLLLVALSLGVSLQDVATEELASQIILLPDASVHLHPSWVVPRATAAPGLLTFRALRTAPVEGPPGSVAQLNATYNLLGYEVVGNDHFAGTNAGLPLGPQTADPGQTNGDDEDTSPGPLLYRRTMPIASLATGLADDLAGNPYAGVGHTADLRFHLVDLYGNRTSELGTLAVDVGYRDPMLNIDDWPGIAVGYAVDGEAQELSVSFEVDPRRFVAAGGSSTTRRAALLAADRQHLLLAEQQLADEHVIASLRSGLDPEGEHRVDRSLLHTVVSQTRRWLDRVAQLQPLEVTHERGQPVTLAAAAESHQVAVAALAVSNADNPHLLRVGATLVNPEAEDGPLLTVGEDHTLGAIAAACQVTVEALAAANATRGVLDPNARYTVPLHDIAPEDTSGGGWYTHNRKRRLATIATNAGVTAEALIRANLTIVGLLTPGRRLILADRSWSEPVREGDTFATLLARLEAQTGGPINLTTLVKHNNVLSAKPGPKRGDPPTLLGLEVRTGSTWIIPPIPVDPVTMPLRVTATTDLIPLRFSLALHRPLELVDHHFSATPEVWRSEVDIPPTLERDQASSPDTAPAQEPLLPLAKQLAAALPGWRMGRESVPRFGTSLQDNLFLVEDVTLTAQPKEAAFYWPKPLMTRPWRGDIASGPVVSADLNAWNGRLLAAIEVALSPRIGTDLAGLDGDAFQRLINAKRSLATSVARRTVPVIAERSVDDERRQLGRASAAEIVRQRLLRHLDSGNGAGCVIDVPLDIKREDTECEDTDREGAGRLTTPRRLFGRVETVGSDTTFAAPVAHPGEAKANLVGPDATLTFALDAVGDPGAVSVRLRWQPVSIEFDLGAGRGEYGRSRWITFIDPPDPVDLGRQHVPTPSPTLPTDAQLIADDLVYEWDEPVAEVDLQAIRAYHYRVDYRLSDHDGDRPELELLANDAATGDETEHDQTGDEPPHELAEALAMFVAMEDGLLADLGSGDEIAVAALNTLTELAAQVASQWQTLTEQDSSVSAREPGLTLTAKTVRSAGTGRTEAATSDMLDGLVANVVTGEITIVRNEQLISGQETNPHFVLRSHPSRMPLPQWFGVTVAAPIDVTSLPGADDDPNPAPLVERLASALSQLAGHDHDHNVQPLDIEVEASVEYGPDGLGLRTPIGLRPRRVIDVERDFVADAPSGDPADQGLSRQLAATLGEAASQAVADGDGRWVLLVRIFATAAGPNAKPLIDYRRVVIPFSSVTPPEFS